MHFPVMIISEKPLDDLFDVLDVIGPYTEDPDDPCYVEDHDHKFDFLGLGGRYDWMLNGESSCTLEDFPMIRPEDTDEDLKRKCPRLWEAWIKNPQGETLRECFWNHFCFCLVLPDGTWLEPGRRYAWWLGTFAEYEKDIDWVVEFGKILDSYPRDWYLNLVDCHI